jgi:hypothetical protein
MATNWLARLHFSRVIAKPRPLFILNAALYRAATIEEIVTCESFYSKLRSKITCRCVSHIRVKRENNASNHSSNDSILQDASH